LFCFLVVGLRGSHELRNKSRVVFVYSQICISVAPEVSEKSSKSGSAINNAL